MDQFTRSTSSSGAGTDLILNPILYARNHPCAHKGTRVLLYDEPKVSREMARQYRSYERQLLGRGEEGVQLCASPTGGRCWRASPTYYPALATDNPPKGGAAFPRPAKARGLHVATSR